MALQSTNGFSPWTKLGVPDSLVRKVLNTTMNEQLLDVVSLHTLLCGAETLINSMAITKPSSDLNDSEALKLKHLLLLKVKLELQPGRWRQVQYLAYVFWKLWCK